MLSPYHHPSTLHFANGLLPPDADGTTNTTTTAMSSLTPDKLIAPKRASTSRRSLMGSGFSPSGPRSRSAERNVPEPDEGGGDDRVNGNGDGNGATLARRYFRCDSDPLDAAGDDEELLDAPPAAAPGGGRMREPIPTLPRYPIAATQNRNCWSEPPHARFKVRGKDYLRERRPSKVPSGPYLFRALGADLILTNASSGPVGGVAGNYPTILGGHVRSAPTFVINFVCPWGLILNYYRIPEFYLPYLRANGDDEARRSLRASVGTLRPHERAMARFLLGTDDERSATLKLVPVAVEGPLVVKKMVQGRPAIIGRRLPATYTYYPADAEGGAAECLEVDLDVNETDSVGKAACNMTRRYTSSVTVDLGFVIEGQTEDEVSNPIILLVGRQFFFSVSFRCWLMIA